MNMKHSKDFVMFTIMKLPMDSYNVSFSVASDPPSLWTKYSIQITRF